jgi:hypothetical protein
VPCGSAPVDANRPMSSIPTNPPTPCTATTSREPSKPHRYFRPTANAHTTPATSPIAMAPTGCTYAHPGVIPASPATAPDAAPSVVGLPSRTCSTTSQPSTAVAPAVIVFTNAVAARFVAPSADPR